MVDFLIHTFSFEIKNDQLYLGCNVLSDSMFSKKKKSFNLYKIYNHQTFACPDTSCPDENVGLIKERIAIIKK